MDTNYKKGKTITTSDGTIMTTFDGKYVNCPKNVIYEVKYPALDVKGTVS
jgi:hypothetical protein